MIARAMWLFGNSNGRGVLRRTLVEFPCKLPQLADLPVSFSPDIRYGWREAEHSAMDDSAKKNQDVIRRFAWQIASISVHIEEIRHFWAKTLGISGPQWMIITALADSDQGEGVAVNAVSKMLHVDPSFVTTQSKLLEKRGFVRRRPSKDDARIVKMSLTDKTSKHLASLAAQQETLNEFIFAEFSARELDDVTNKLAALKKRLEKACLKVAADF
jgi:DNA-binding MarR family transcriptional regulator